MIFPKLSSFTCLLCCLYDISKVIELYFLFIVKDPDTDENLELGKYMHNHEITDVSKLILKESDSADVRRVKGNTQF